MRSTKHRARRPSGAGPPSPSGRDTPQRRQDPNERGPDSKARTGPAFRGGRATTAGHSLPVQLVELQEDRGRKDELLFPSGSSYLVRARETSTCASGSSTPRCPRSLSGLASRSSRHSTGATSRSCDRGTWTPSSCCRRQSPAGVADGRIPVASTARVQCSCGRPRVYGTEGQRFESSRARFAVMCTGRGR
jgi:hypothetical protein